MTISMQALKLAAMSNKKQKLNEILLVRLVGNAYCILAYSFGGSLDITLKSKVLYWLSDLYNVNGQICWSNIGLLHA